MMLKLLFLVLAIPAAILLWNFCKGFYQAFPGFLQSFNKGRQDAAFTDEEKQEVCDYVAGRITGRVSEDSPIFRPKFRVVGFPD
jgi:hypothetical protein